MIKHKRLNYVASSNRLKDIVRNLYYDILHYENRETWRSKEAQKYAAEFHRFYQDGGCNLYSATYNWLSGLDKEQLLESSVILDIFLFEIEHCLEQRNSPHLEKLTELHDNIRLEITRSQMQSAKEVSVDKKLEEATKKLREIEELRDSYEQDRKESSAQTITVLSIFTGIAMAFFGGFSLLGSAFSNIAYGVPAVAVISSLIGFILFNTVFMFLYMAGKLSGRSISVCRSVGCDNCPERELCTKGKKSIPGFWTRGRKRYPYIVVVNICLVILLAGSLWLFIRLPNHGVAFFDDVPDRIMNQQQIQQSASYSEPASSVSQSPAVPDPSSVSSSVPSSTPAPSAAPSSTENAA